VVIVILGILLAIAVPALTGYIQKAQDKEWAMKARAVVTAYRAVLEMNYAKGNFNDIQLDAIQNGNSTSTVDAKVFWGSLGDTLNWKPSAQEQTNELLNGAAGHGYFPTDLDYQEYTKNTPSHSLSLVGFQDSNTTALNADGFHVLFMYDYSDRTTFNSSVVVTYKMDRDDTLTTYLDYMAGNYSKVYNPDAGYEVYHLSIS
jgi:type II secretory pathway pseudopilin PulG